MRWSMIKRVPYSQIFFRGIFSLFETMLGEAPAQDRKALVIFQTGLTGLTGCASYLNPVHPVILSRIKKPQMNAYERRFVAITHRKGRKGPQQNSLSSGEETAYRRRTRMTRIKRIFTDNPIRAYPRHPCNLCSIVYNSNEKIRNLWHFTSIKEQEAGR